MINATFGETPAYVRKHMRFELVNTETRFQKLVDDPTFDNAIAMNINDNLCGVMRKDKNIQTNRRRVLYFRYEQITYV